MGKSLCREGFPWEETGPHLPLVLQSLPVRLWLETASPRRQTPAPGARSQLDGWGAEADAPAPCGDRRTWWKRPDGCACSPGARGGEHWGSLPPTSWPEDQRRQTAPRGGSAKEKQTEDKLVMAPPIHVPTSWKLGLNHKTVVHAGLFPPRSACLVPVKRRGLQQPRPRVTASVTACPAQGRRPHRRSAEQRRHAVHPTAPTGKWHLGGGLSTGWN